MANLLLLIAGFIFTRPSDSKEKKKAGDGKTTNMVLLAILGIGGYFVLNSAIKKQQLENTLNDAGNDLATQQAIQLEAAAHTGLGGWAEDEDMILKIGAQIKDFAAVRAAYLRIFKEELTTELAKWLSATQVAQFMASINKVGTGGVQGGVTTPSPTTPTPTTPAPTTPAKANKYNYNNLPNIAGKTVKVNTSVSQIKGTLPYFNLSNNKLQDSAGANATLGTAVGWVFRQNVVCVAFTKYVFEITSVPPFFFFGDVEYYCNANYVRTE